MSTQTLKSEKHDTSRSMQPAAKAEMLIRKPVSEVFEAFVNPEITSRFWFTKGSARLEEGKTVEWEWSMYNFKLNVTVQEVKQNSFISLVWSGTGKPTTVELTFRENDASATFVSIVETGPGADDENVFQFLVGNTEGWTIVLAALKALLEHNIILTLVADRHPEGFESEG